MKISSYAKDLLREIWNNKSRFLSIFAIIALGTGFFAGLKSTCPDMKITAQAYFVERNLMDFQLKSTMGFSDDDIAALNNLNYVKNVQPFYSVDAFLKTDSNLDVIIRAYSIDSANADSADYISKPILMEGRLPRSLNECVIENDDLGKSRYQIGEKISLFFDSSQGDINKTLKCTEFTIVGIVRSPNYITFEKGKSSIGSGRISSVMYIPTQAFKYEVYTDVFLTLKDSGKYAFYDSSYTDLINKYTTELENFGKDRAKIRYAEIKSDADDELSKAETKLNSGWRAYYSQKNAYDLSIQAALDQIQQAQQTLDANQKLYDDGLAAYNQGLADAEKSEQDLITAQAALDIQKNQLSQLTATYNFISASSLPDTYTLPDEIISAVNSGSFPAGFKMFINSSQPISTDMFACEVLNLSSANKQSFFYIVNSSAYYSSLTQDKQNIILALENLYILNLTADTKAEFMSKVSAYISTSDGQIAAAQQSIDDGYTQLAAAKQLLADKQTELFNAKAQLDAGNASLEQNKNTLNAQISAASKQFADSYAQLVSAQNKLDSSKDKLDELKQPKWYIFDRTDNPGYTGYVDDSERVDRITVVFPIFFIIVAALVCLTTMTRMVEEQRGKIGTYRSLGYSKFKVISIYLAYAALASFLGSMVGLSIGFKLFPIVIFNAYRILYILPDLIAPFRLDYAFYCTLASVLVTTVASYIACRKELQISPASLLRPKAPKAGKRILLEKIGFIWSRLGFIRKVTLRNMFRYKKRLLMTIIGIAGCTALILAGFGLQNSITSIVQKQYEDIYLYDFMGYYNDEISAKGLTELENTINENSMITSYMFIQQKAIDVSYGDAKKNVYMMIADNSSDVPKYIKLQNRATKEPLTLQDEGCVITEKISKLLNIKVGDEITVSLGDNSTFTTPVTGITENYTLNYIYMTKDAYTEATGEKPELNAFIGLMTDDNKSDELSAQMLENKNILYMAYSKDSGGKFRDVVSNLNYIVLVIIVSAGLLAFIVLYNLISINVNERVREIATIKVLGFFDREVSSYIYKENTLSSLIGIGLGLLAGIPLEKFIIASAEIDAVMFAPGINFMSFVYAGALTLLFNITVNFFVHFRLKKIDMVESLKSVE